MRRRRSKRRPRAAAAAGGRAASVTVLISVAGFVSGERGNVQLWLWAGQEREAGDVRASQWVKGGPLRNYIVIETTVHEATHDRHAL
jgi:hypothetical protein